MRGVVKHVSKIEKEQQFLYEVFCSLQPVQERTSS
jgi:hypothetical protein